MVVRFSESQVLTITWPGREPSGVPCLYCAPEASFSRNASTGITSTFAFGRRPKSCGSFAHIWSMYLRYRSRICWRDCGCSLGSFCDGGVEPLEVGVAELLRDLQHLRPIARHLAQAELVDLLRRHARGRRLLDGAGVPRLAVRQRPHAGLGAPLRRVLVLHELGELLVRRHHAVADRRQHLLADARLVRVGERRRELLRAARRTGSPPARCRRSSPTAAPPARAGSGAASACPPCPCASGRWSGRRRAAAAAAGRCSRRSPSPSRRRATRRAAAPGCGCRRSG